MSTILNILSHLPKRLSIFFALMAAVLTSFSSFAAPEVIIESNIAIANHTQGDTQYEPVSRTASYDDIVRFKVYYHNTENPDSGKIAESVSIKVDLPTEAGRTQTVTSTVKGSNTNTVIDNASAILDRDDAYLEFVPGSVEWKHNIGTRENVQYETLKFRDDVITGNGFTPIEHQKPCFEYEAWITFSMVVRVPSVEIEKEVSDADEQSWREQVTSNPGSDVAFQLNVRNNGNARLDGVIVRDELPEGLTYKNGSTKLFNSNHPDGITLSDNITKNGVNIGDLPNDTNGILTFVATVDGADHFECGMNTLVNNAQAYAIGFNGVEDTASVKVNKTCDEPTYDFECTGLNLVTLDEEARTVRATANTSMSNNVLLDGVSIDFGDGTVVDQNGAEHTYSSEGEYTVTATVTFVFNNADQTVRTVKCSDSVTFEDDQVFAYKCDALNIVTLNEDTRTISATAATVQSDNVTVAGVSIDFGDGTVVNQNGAEHTYSSEGEYTVTATVDFALNDENDTVKSVECSAKVTFEDEVENCPIEGKQHLPVDSADCKKNPETPKTPTSLPNTGAGSAIVSFFGATSAAAAAYGYVQTKRSV